MSVGNLKKEYNHRIPLYVGYKNQYILLQFDGYDLNVVTHVDHVYYNGTVRGILRGDYLYVVDSGGIVIVDLSIPCEEEGHVVRMVN